MPGPTGLGIIRRSAGVPLDCGLILSNRWAPPQWWTLRPHRGSGLEGRGSCSEPPVVVRSHSIYSYRYQYIFTTTYYVPPSGEPPSGSGRSVGFSATPLTGSERNIKFLGYKDRSVFLESHQATQVRTALYGGSRVSRYLDWIQSPHSDVQTQGPRHRGPG